MLYSNSTKSHSPAGGPPDDLFNKNKLAEEAKRDRVGQETVQKQQEKNKLQLQIDNLKRELDKLVTDLRLKETRSSELKRKLDDAKREVFLLQGEIKKREGGIGYLSDEAKVEENQTVAQKSQLADLKSRKENVMAEINRLKKEIAERESLISSDVVKSEKLEQQYNSLETESKQTKGLKSRVSRSVQGEERKIKGEKQGILFKKRIMEQLEKDSELVSQELAKLNRDKALKERQIEDLKRKKDSIR